MSFVTNKLGLDAVSVVFLGFCLLWCCLKPVLLHTILYVTLSQPVEEHFLAAHFNQSPTCFPYDFFVMFVVYPFGGQGYLYFLFPSVTFSGI